MNPLPPNISVAVPISQAFDWTQRTLFKPFDLYRWLAIGFTAWLATLGESWGGGGGGGGRGGGNAQGMNDWNPRESWNEARAYIADNLSWLVPTAILALVVVVALSLLILWLSSRGRFMFAHNVALNRADVVVPWRDYQRHGNSLFLFRVVVALVGFVFSAPLLVLGGVAGFSMIIAEKVSAGPMLLAVVSGLVLVVIGIAFAVVEKLTKDFVVPIMWMRQPSCRSAWGEFGTLLRSRPGNFALYILFHILLTLGAAVLIIALILITCCIAGCLFALPYLGTVFLLPYYVFFRSYSLLYLAQYGPDYDVFRIPVGPAAGASPGIT